MSRAGSVTVARSPIDTDGSRDGRARPRTAACRGRGDHAGAPRAAPGASGLDRIVGVMSASGSYEALSSNRGRGATMGPPACSDQSSPVAFRSCCYTRLQGLSASWDDWRGQKVFLIRKRSQVRVLDRPSTGSRNCLHLNNILGFGLLKDRHGRGVPRGHMGPPAVTCGAKKALLVSRRCQVGAGSENAVRRVLSELAGERSERSSRRLTARVGRHRPSCAGAERQARASARIGDRRAAYCRGCTGASARRRAVVFRRDAMVRRTAGRAAVSVARDGEHSGRARRSRQLARSDPGSVTMRRSKQ
jgi:hypothetical protein